MQDSPPSTSRESIGLLRKILVRGSPFIGTLLLIAVVSIFRDELKNFADYGYLGIILACFAANATIFLPAPSSAIVLVMSQVYHPLGVAIAGGIGASLGELMGYGAGRSGRPILDRSQRSEIVQTWLSRHTFLTIFLTAFLPLPLFDIVGIGAGVLGVPVVRFIPPLVLGKLLKMLTYAYIGSGALQYFNHIAE